MCTIRISKSPWFPGCNIRMPSNVLSSIVYCQQANWISLSTGMRAFSCTLAAAPICLLIKYILFYSQHRTNHPLTFACYHTHSLKLRVTYSSLSNLFAHFTSKILLISYSNQPHRIIDLISVWTLQTDGHPHKEGERNWVDRMGRK